MESLQNFAGDVNAPRGYGFESRGRERGRGREKFGQARGMPFNSNQDFDHQSVPGLKGPRRYSRRDGKWNPHDVDAQAAPESGDAEQVVRWEEKHTEVDEQLDDASKETE
ncbi:unnamed protein product [Trichobilharzia regenti]|nr:unnamed protein product [Trichobilharzia regenti]